MTSIGADEASGLVADAVSLARQEGTAVSIALTDETGSLVAFQRMQGAPRFSADFAIAKARTAAAFAVPTSNLEELYKDRPAFAHSFVAQGGYFLGRGGIPIFRSGELIAAIGVSGATAAGEEALAIHVIDSADGIATAT